MTATPLPVVHAAALADSHQEVQWLVEDLWGEGAVGLCGGEPKSYKTFMALDLAVAVASGRPCLGRFAVPRPGPVVLFAAEDAPPIVKRRLTGITTSRGVALKDCDLHVITAERLRLDADEDVDALDATIAMLKPRLLVLDPFVRLHRIDENSSAEVAKVLDRLRVMQRRHGVAILVVHHARKGGSSVRAGQALRGSSEFHAWLDSLLYLRRTGKDDVKLTVEHRAARSEPGGMSLSLVDDGKRLALEIQESDEDEDSTAAAPTTAQRVLGTLSTTTPMTTKVLRNLCGMRMSRLCETLAALAAEGRVRHMEGGYVLADS